MSMESVRKAFQEGSNGKLKLEDCVMNYTPDGPVLTVTGWYPDKMPFAQTTAPFGGNPNIRALQLGYDLLKTHSPGRADEAKAREVAAASGSPKASTAEANNQAGVGSERPSPGEPLPIQAFRKQIAMGKLQQIASRAPQVVKALEARADNLGTRLDALEKHGNSTFDRWATHLSDQESAISEAEDAINQLSNGAPPLGNS